MAILNFQYGLSVICPFVQLVDNNNIHIDTIHTHLCIITFFDINNIHINSKSVLLGPIMENICLDIQRQGLKWLLSNGRKPLQMDKEISLYLIFVCFSSKMVSEMMSLCRNSIFKFNTNSFDFSIEFELK